MLMRAIAEAELEAEAGGARRGEGGGWGFGDFDLAVEEVFAGGEEFEALAEVVRGIGVEAEVAVEEIGVGVVVELAAAQAALQAERAELGRKARRLRVAMLRATSGIQLPRS